MAYISRKFRDIRQVARLSRGPVRGAGKGTAKWLVIGQNVEDAALDIAAKMFPKATIRRFDDDAQAFQEVVNGNAHATISSAPKPRFWSEAHPEKMFLPFGSENLTKGDEALALRKGDADAVNYFSNWILVNTSNGWLKATHDKWFQDQSAWKDLVAPDQ